MGTGASAGINVAISELTEDELTNVIHQLTVDAREQLDQAVKLSESAAVPLEHDDEITLGELDLAWGEAELDAERLAEPPKRTKGGKKLRMPAESLEALPRPKESAEKKWEEFLEFDQTLAAALRQGLLRLISCDFLLAQAAGWEMPRMQELREIDGALLDPAKAAALLMQADRSILAVSHGWLSRNHPDPRSERLNVLCTYLRSLRSAGALPPGAGLFWDFGSLPQKPRSSEEEHTFRRALRVMADVYASPFGTKVIQIKPIPPRPAELEGCVLACEIHEHVSDSILVEDLSQFGKLLKCERSTSGAPDASARYEDHEDAISAAESEEHEKLLGEGAFVCLEYNDRQYEERGWCVAEEMFSTECLLRLALPKMARPKVVSLSDTGVAVEVNPLDRSVRDMEHTISRATFTGKGDRKTVLQICLTYQRRLSKAQEAQSQRKSMRRSLSK